MLWQFSNPDIAASIESLTAEIAALDGRIERLASDTRTRNQAPIFQGEKERLLAELKTQLQRQSDLTISATHSGLLRTLVADLPLDQNVPIALAPETLLGSIVTLEAATVTALIPASAVKYIPRATTAKFRVGLESIHPTLERDIQIIDLTVGTNPVSEITLPEAVKRFGGAIETDPQNPMAPIGNWFSVNAQVANEIVLDHPMSASGVLVIKGQKRSYADRIWSQISLTLIQQLGN